MDESTLLEVNDLHVSYTTDAAVNYAVNGITFSLIPGKTLGFVGETGAGKTTAALSIMGLLPKGIGKVTKGSITFRGRDILTMPESELRLIRGSQISMIFQDPMTSLNPVITVGKQIAEVLRYHSEDTSKEAIENKVDSLLNLVGISDSRKNEYPHQFSGGMKQRIVIAIAVACNPVLLIADEPTTALDVTIQAQVLEIIANLKEKLGTSMIMITHDLGIVAQTCDDVAIMYSGEIVEYGGIRDIFEGTVRHPYTEGLFGSIPDIKRVTKRLTPIGGQMTDPSRLPSGCKFHPRCKDCIEICKTQNPKLYQFAPGHLIKCHRKTAPEEICL